MKKPKVDKSIEPKEWTAVGFLDEFMRIHERMKDCAFAFLLGAGASITSKIPDGGKLARQWVEDLYGFSVEDKVANPIEDWATPENLGIPGFKLNNVAAFYPQVYDQRFSDNSDLGYASLEDAMNQAEPNIGYSILAKVLENTRHKVVITTNFDNLVADALSIYTDTFPLVCGHELLTGFVRTRLRRPLVAKIHRDLLMAPISDSDGTSRLDGRWANVLRMLLRDYTPIVLGYGGNDGSLMGFLEELKSGEIQGGIYWCYHRASGRPDQHICNLVAKHKGRLVPILGFDEFMVQLGQKLGYKPLADEIESRARIRVKRYRDQWERTQKRLTEPSKDAETEKVVKPVREALAATVQKEDSWWAWELKARAEQDPAKREEIYRQGCRQFPKSAKLASSFALFVHEVRKDYDKAEQLYKRALELDPDNVATIGNFALFLHEVRKDYDKAEQLYKRALELDPDDAFATGNLALFMDNVRKNFDEAERLYRRTLTLDPNHVTHIGNFAYFMAYVREGYNEAESLYRRALELGSDNANTMGNFAGFLLGQSRLDEAKEQAIQALAINKGEIHQLAAEVLMYWCLIVRMEGRDDTSGIARLKYILEKGFLRAYWSFEYVLEAAKDKIDSDEFDFYSALADAILDAEKVSQLDRFERWKQIKPISLNEPWDMSGD